MERFGRKIALLALTLIMIAGALVA